MTDQPDRGRASRAAEYARLHDAHPSPEAPASGWPDALPAVDWAGAGIDPDLRPRGIELPSSFGGDDPLPKADLAVMTWTKAEWLAMDHVFCESDSKAPVQGLEAKSWEKAPWHLYRRGYDKWVAYLEKVKSSGQGHAPSLDFKAWGGFRMAQVGKLKVLLIKSDMHLHQDGPELPLTDFVAHICDEAKPGLLLSIGTAGGVRAEDGLGSALVTDQALFHFEQEFKDEPYNHTVVRSGWKPPDRHLGAAQGLTIQLKSPPVPPPSPQYPGPLESGPADSKLKIVDSPIITADYYLFGTTTNGLDRLGCVVEMDDAVVGRAAQQAGTAFGFVRNVSDPVINGDMPCDLQDFWAGQFYREAGIFSSFNGALATWAVMAAAR